MPFIETRDARIHYRTFGSGGPTTLFAHGLGSTIDDTRPLASGVTGSRVFFDARGHGETQLYDADPRWDYGALAGDLLAVADEVGATRCVGVSMGAGALLRLLVGAPDRFHRCVFALPPPLVASPDDRHPNDWDARADVVETGDAQAVVDVLATDIPLPLRGVPAIQQHLHRKAESLRAAGASDALRGVSRHDPLDSLEMVAHVGVSCLVIAQDGDDVHPAETARTLARALPNSRLHVLESGGVWSDRKQTRTLISEFLNA